LLDLNGTDFILLLLKSYIDMSKIHPYFHSTYHMMCR